jgi:membrane protein DedA with SNARE-associated domain
VTSFLAHHGLWAVFVLMAIDAVFPAASELVMLYGGALASGALTHQLDVFGTRSIGAGAYVAIALAGTVGYLIGSLGGWAIGFYGGRRFVERHGRWVHLNPDRLDRAERWFERWEGWAVLVGRVTPVARSFVSIPAGVFEARLARYTALTAIGSAAWCFAFAGAGWALGSRWESFHHNFRYVDYAVVAGILVLAAYWLVRRRRSPTLDPGSPETRRASDTPR